MPNDKFKNIKYYAKLYGISVLKENGKHKSVNELSVDIWEYERTHVVKDGLYPFLSIK
jgi:hypothetical protein